MIGDNLGAQMTQQITQEGPKMAPNAPERGFQRPTFYGKFLAKNFPKSFGLWTPLSGAPGVFSGPSWCLFLVLLASLHAKWSGKSIQTSGGSLFLCRKWGRNGARPPISLVFCYIAQNFKCTLMSTPKRHFVDSQWFLGTKLKIWGADGALMFQKIMLKN